MAKGGWEMITEEKLAELRKSVHRNFEMISDIANPPNIYRMGDFLDTLSALWRVVRAAENEGLDAMMDSYPQMSEALAALREGKETR